MMQFSNLSKDQLNHELKRLRSYKDDLVNSGSSHTSPTVMIFDNEIRSVKNEISQRD